MAPEPEGEEVIFKDWIQDIWPAFEEAGSATEFKSELQSQYHSLPYDNEVFSYWEVQEGDPNWEDTFWDYYENDVIEEYYGAAMEREEYEEKAMNLADTIEEIMQAEIRKRYG
ncbi:hypothetical protein DVR14_08445 [Natrinema thermotolerans]|nr:hypothetical protein DVR14_08445 [Natrinema thermotolerans]